MYKWSILWNAGVDPKSHFFPKALNICHLLHLHYPDYWRGDKVSYDWLLHFSTRGDFRQFRRQCCEGLSRSSIFASNYLAFVFKIVNKTILHLTFVHSEESVARTSSLSIFAQKYASRDIHPTFVHMSRDIFNTRRWCWRSSVISTSSGAGHSLHYIKE